MSTITVQEIDVLAGYIFAISGIHLDRSKGYLLETRLKPLLAAHGCRTYHELYRLAKDAKRKELDREIIDAISTNETFFFRDNTPFELLRNKIIPELIDRRSLQYQGKIPLRIWSAACSTGQEVYSIGMTLLELLPNPGKYEISILGTDISSQAIGRASYGLYDSFEMERGLPRDLRQKYFTPAGNGWRVKDQVRVLARFKKLNLLRPFGELGKFDVIFCRNVAIYFDRPSKILLFDNIGRVLQPDGALFVGGSESLSGLQTGFQVQRYLRGVYYILNGRPTVPSPALQAVKQVTVRPEVKQKAKGGTPVRPAASPPAVPPPRKNSVPGVARSPRPGNASPSASATAEVKPGADPAPGKAVRKEVNRPFSAPKQEVKVSLLTRLGENRDPGRSLLAARSQGDGGDRESLLARISRKKKAEGEKEASGTEEGGVEKGAPGPPGEK